jgi:hypothetical protein
MAKILIIFLILHLLVDLVTMVPLMSPQDVLRERHENAPTLFVMKRTQLRHDWCKTRVLKQVVESDGCRPLQVHNNYCFGQCNSVYIPLSGDKSSFESCAVCTPMLAYYKVVTLKCPRKIVKYKRKKIQYIKRCRCIAAELTALNTYEKPDRVLRVSKGR